MSDLKYDFKDVYKGRIKAAIDCVAEVYYELFDQLPNDKDTCELICSEIEKGLIYSRDYCKQVLDNMNSHEEFNKQFPNGKEESA